jgi:hypothetical protein
MGRVEYSQLQAGDTATATQLNTIFSAIATETSAVDGENVAEEGVDSSMLDAGVTTAKAFSPVNLNTITSQVLSTSWATTVINATNLRSSGVFTMTTRDLVRIRGSIELFTDTTNYGIPAGGQVDVRIGFYPTGGPAASTTPQVGYSTSINTGGRIPIMAVLLGSSYSSIDWVEIQVSDQSGGGTTVQLRRGQLQATIFKGVL